MGQKLLKKEHTVLAFFVIYSYKLCHSQTITSASIWFCSWQFAVSASVFFRNLAINVPLTDVTVFARVASNASAEKTANNVGASGTVLNQSREILTFVGI